MNRNQLLHVSKLLLVGFLFLFSTLQVSATQYNPPTDANVYGHVVEAETQEHLAGISIRIEGTLIGTATDATGHYFIANLKPGRYTLVMSGIGYKQIEKEVTITAGKMTEVNFEAEEDIVNMDAVVVTADRGETIRRLAPTLVGVIDNRTFTRTSSHNLLQGLSFQPGLRVENNCQNCGFNQVRINGLDGKYTQILIDSRPIFSSLAGIYGLEQIPTSMVERIEVVRGGGSALYGSSSIGGIINIITKNPSGNSAMVSESLAFTGMRRPDNNLSFNASVVSNGSRAGLILFGQARNRKGWDSDGDGFTELGQLDSRSIGTRVFFKTTNRSQLTGEVHTIQEHRRGGDRFDLPDYVAQISERLDHSIYSGNLKFHGFSADLKHNYSIYTSAQSILRNSYYGGTGDWEGLGIDPNKPIGIGNPMAPENYGTNFGYTRGLTVSSGAQYSYDITEFPLMPLQILVGVEHMYDFLSDRVPLREWQPSLDEHKNPVVDSNGNVVSAFPETRQRLNIWSQILQLEWRNEMFSVLLGGRLDEHSLVKKPIFSPRTTLRYNPTRDINLRFSYAKGFRAPQIFDEDLHVGFANGEQLKIFNDPNLKPESSHSFTLSADMYGRWGDVQGNLLVEGFYNRIIDIFENKETDDIVEGFRYYRRVNSDGAAVYGANLEGRLAYKMLSLQAGMSIVFNQYDTPIEWGEFVATTNGKTLEEGGMPKVEDGAVVNEAQTTKHMLRTPNMYGYFTLNIEPIRRFNIALTGNLFGKMKVPHAIVYGDGAALTDIAAGNDAEKYKSYFDGLGVDSEARAIRIDRLETSPVMMELGAKLSYSFELRNTLLEVSLGMNNIFNAYQKDFDKGPNRDSAYTYGPLAPRTIHCGLKFSF